MYLDNSRIFQIFVLIAVSIFIIVIFVGVNFYRTYKNSKTLDENQEINLLYLAKNQSNISKLNNYVMEEDELIYKRLEPQINRNKKALSDSKDDLSDIETQIASNKKSIKDNSDNIKLNTDNITSQKDILSNYKIDQADVIKKIKDDQKVIQSNIATFTYDDFKNIRERLQHSESNIGNIRAHIVDINVEKIPLLEGRVKDNASNISRIDTELEELDSQFAPINVQLATLSNDIFNRSMSDSILSRLNDVDYLSKKNRTLSSSNSDKFANYTTTSNLESAFDDVVSKDEFEDWLDHAGAFIDKTYMKKEDHTEWLETKYKPLYEKVEGLDKTLTRHASFVKVNYPTITQLERDYMTKEALMKTFVEIPPDKTTNKNKLVEQEDENIV
jgi:hypothetical protein